LKILHTERSKFELIRQNGVYCKEINSGINWSLEDALRGEVFDARHLDPDWLVDDILILFYIDGSQTVRKRVRITKITNE
jgi:hypothetical protein